MKKLLNKRIKDIEDNTMNTDRILGFINGVIKFDDGIEYTHKDFMCKYPQYKDNYCILVTFTK